MTSQTRSKEKKIYQSIKKTGWIDAKKAKGKKLFNNESELKKVEKAIKEGFDASKKFMRRKYVTSIEEL